MNRSIIDRMTMESKYSVITSEIPDKEQFPLYYKASKIEYTLEPGERLFIPAGWFHQVFSEGEDVNFAINFWYDTSNVYKFNDVTLPNKQTHDIKIDLLDLFKDKTEELLVTKSKKRYFPPINLKYRFDDIVSQELISFKDFYESKNPRFYLLQHLEMDKLKKYAFPHVANVSMCNVWVNFGRGAYSLIHFDRLDNWLCQISGRKRVVLYPRSEADKLYIMNPYPNDFAHSLMADLDIDPHIKFLHGNLEEFFCNYLVSKLGDNNILVIPAETYLTEKYFSLEQQYFVLLKKKGCVIQDYSLPKEFVIERACDVKPVVRDFIDSHCSIIWALTLADIKIKNSYIHLNKGDVVMFPSSITHPRRVVSDNTIILYPVYS
jgi:hypothetical protein